MVSFLPNSDARHSGCKSTILQSESFNFERLAAEETKTKERKKQTPAD